MAEAILLDQDVLKKSSVKLKTKHLGRSQDLNRSLQNIAQDFDDDVIVMALMSLS